MFLCREIEKEFNFRGTTFPYDPSSVGKVISKAKRKP
jgi:hypothetical protein